MTKLLEKLDCILVKKIRPSCFIVVRCQLKSLCFLYRTDLVQQLEGQLVPK